MRKIGVLAGMVLAAAAAVAATAPGSAPAPRQTEARSAAAPDQRSAASPSAVDHAKAAIRRYGDAVRWRRPTTKHKHRRPGERAHRRWRRRRATGRRWK